MRYGSDHKQMQREQHKQDRTHIDKCTIQCFYFFVVSVVIISFIIVIKPYNFTRSSYNSHRTLTYTFGFVQSLLTI